MMVKTFEEYIEEGLWSKGVDRSKSGDKRLGDITDFEKYIPTIEWVDMGHPEYLFAKFDFEERGLSADEIENLKLPNGISMMSSLVFNEIIKSKDTQKRAITVDYKDYKNIELKNKITGDKIFFYINHNVDYISNLDMFDDEFSVDLISFSMKKPILNKYEISDVNDPIFYIKLMKKKSLNEGLWSKGIERSKTGEDRLESKYNTNIKTLKGIDLGLPFLFADNDLEIENSDMFTFDDVELYRKTIEKTGWRIPTMEDLNMNTLKGFISNYNSDDCIFKLSSPKNDVSVEFKDYNDDWSIKYWLVDSMVKGYQGERKEMYLKFYIKDVSDQECGYVFLQQNMNIKKKYRIRLIKDK